MHRVFVEREGTSGLYIRRIYSTFRHKFSNIHPETFMDLYSQISVAMSNISRCHLCSVMIVNIF
jgi:hypothetical protein